MAKPLRHAWRANALITNEAAGALGERPRMGFRRRKAPVVNEPVTDDPDFTLAVEEARRNFDSLNTRLADLRNRSLQLVTVGGLLATFVGGLSALRSNGLSVWDAVALMAFALIVIICLIIWWPRKLQTSQTPSILVEWAETPSITRQSMNRDLALHLGDHYKANRKVIDRMQNWFCVALLLLIGEVVCLAVGLWVR
jgi:hypothetical protein